DALGERLPVEELHGNKGLAFLLPKVIDGAYVGMVKCGGSARFTLEALQSLRIVGQSFRKKLQGHTAPQARVLGFVNHTHASSTQLMEDAVMRDRLIDHGGDPNRNGNEW